MDERPPRFADALRHRAFAVPFAAEIQSIAGDQLARVALSVLVFRETGSAAATGLTFAATFLPAIVGGAVLGHLGDRFPRRTVMIAVDLIRAALFALMAAPGVPTPALLTLLVVAVFVGPLFTSAEVSYLAGMLRPEVFRIATGLRMLSNQGAQVVGFALGGVLVAGLGSRPVLAIDAATFLVSVALIGLLAPAEPPRRDVDSGPEVPDARTVRAVLWQDRRTRALITLSLLAGFFIAPEGVAVPFADQGDAPTTRAGLLLAAIPLGSVVGVYVLVRRVPRDRRMTAASAMAVLCGVPLVVSGWLVSFPVAFVCWFASGAFAAYQVEVMTGLVQAIPDRLRARSIGICNALLLGAQGVGVGVFGSVADALTPAHSVAMAGAIGSALALMVVLGPLRVRPGAGSATGRHRDPSR